MPQARNGAVPLRVRLNIAVRDFRADRRAKRHAGEFVGMSPEEAQIHADKLGLELRLGPADEASTAERSRGRINATVRDGVVEEASAG